MRGNAQRTINNATRTNLCAIPHRNIDVTQRKSFICAGDDNTMRSGPPVAQRSAASCPPTDDETIRAAFNSIAALTKGGLHVCVFLMWRVFVFVLHSTPHKKKQSRVGKRGITSRVKFYSREWCWVVVLRISPPPPSSPGELRHFFFCVFLCYT